MVEIPGKKVYRMDRNSRGGGVCIYVNSNISPHCEIYKKSTFANRNIEIISLDIKKPGLKYMMVSCIYRPPRGNVVSCIDTITEMIARNENSKKEIWFLGDFNLDYLDRANSNVNKFNVLFKKYGMKQYVTDPIRPGKYKDSCIDWLITNSWFVSHVLVSDIFISDHLAVCCLRKKAREKTTYTYRSLRDYKNYDQHILSELLQKRLSDLEFFDCEDPNILWHYILKSTTDILEIMCPIRRYKQRQVITSWMNAEIYRAIRLRERLVRNFKLSRSNHDLVRMRQQRNHVNSLIESAKKTYICNTLRQNQKNPRKFWKLIKNMLDGSNYHTEANQFVDPDTNLTVPLGNEPNYFCNISTRLGFDDLAPLNADFKFDVDEMYADINAEFNLISDPFVTDELQPYIDSVDITKSSCVMGVSTFVCRDVMRVFPSHIVHLYNCSIRTGIFPYDWSRGCITVIPKSGKLSNPSNWRPITQTSIFAKILEKLVYKRLLSYFDENDILSKYQYGFRSNKSTQQAVFELVKFIHSGLNNKKLIPCICLDVCKAFDCINHEILLYKFRSIGCSESTVSWFKSYLTRTQTVRYNNVLSDILNIKTGIGQGTILGPLIFIFYINDIIVRTGRLKINMYADDCILFTSGNNWDNIKERIQPDLDGIQSWCENNRLRLSITKSKTLLL